MKKLIEFSAVEYKKDEDSFCMDRALFYHVLFKNFGEEYLDDLFPFLEKYVGSDKESEQRVGAEITYGLIR